MPRFHNLLSMACSSVKIRKKKHAKDKRSTFCNLITFSSSHVMGNLQLIMVRLLWIEYNWEFLLGFFGTCDGVSNLNWNDNQTIGTWNKMKFFQIYFCSFLDILTKPSVAWVHFEDCDPNAHAQQEPAKSRSSEWKIWSNKKMDF